MYYDDQGVLTLSILERKCKFVIAAQATHVIRTEPRADARVTFPDGSVYSAPIGTLLLEYVNTAFPRSNPLIVGAVIDNQLVELTYSVQRDIQVAPITLGDSDGARIYRRSLVFLMTAAVEVLFPGVKIAVQHSVPDGGFYCELVGRPNFTDTEIEQIRTQMRALVDANKPITRTIIPLEEARAWFKKRGDDDMLRLLESRDKPYLTVYSMDGLLDYLFGYMVPSTGYLSVFDLIRTESGFILRYPRPESPDRLLPRWSSKKLESVFIQARDWQELMGLQDIGDLNRVIREGRMRDEVLIAEALHSRHISEIAAEIARRHAQGIRLVLIAGPSSSGKTTFSKRLAVQLMAYGIQPFTLAMDNYFVDRDHTPRDENGEFDFEALDALNRVQLNRDMLALMAGESVQMPHFDFKAGRSFPGEVAQLTNSHIIIAEGIHGLNPALIPEIPIERVVRIYVSALTTLNLDRHNRVPTTDLRLLRRIVRDANTRGYSAMDTLSRWESVRRGEKDNIFPYQENADLMFNSGLAYELAVLRRFAEPLLRQVEPNTPHYIEAKRLLAFLRWVLPTSPEFIPDDSLLREFVGGSILETYTPGTRQNGNHTNHNSKA